MHFKIFSFCSWEALVPSSASILGTTSGEASSWSPLIPLRLDCLLSLKDGRASVVLMELDLQTALLISSLYMLKMIWGLMICKCSIPPHTLHSRSCHFYSMFAYSWSPLRPPPCSHQTRIFRQTEKQWCCSRIQQKILLDLYHRNPTHAWPHACPYHDFFSLSKSCQPSNLGFNTIAMEISLP